MVINQPRFVFVPHVLFSEQEDGPIDDVSSSASAGVLNMGGAEMVAHIVHVAEMLEPLVESQRRQIYGPAATNLQNRMLAQSSSIGAGQRPGVWVTLEEAIELGLMPSPKQSCTAYEISAPAPLNMKGDQHSILHKLQENRKADQTQKQKNSWVKR